MKIVPGVYAVDFDGQVWAYLYRHGSRFTLIDCGIDGRLEVLESEIRDLGAHLSDIEQLVLTHAHEDHAGTAAELQRLTKVPTFAHKLDAPFVRGEETIPPKQLNDSAKRLHEQIVSNVPPAPAAKVDTELSDGDVIALGDDRAVVVHVPGHTPGSIALWVAERRLLFTGDAAAATGKPIVGVFNIDPERAKQSFGRFVELDAETACFGHGRPIASGAGKLIRGTLESPDPLGRW